MRTLQHNDAERHKNGCALPADAIITAWEQLSEGQQTALLPQILVKTKGWHEINRLGDTKAVDTWLMVLFHKANIRYWK
jgi:hypothetical protein